MTLTANPDGIYGWQVRIKTLAANADGNYGWQVRIMNLAANPVVMYGWQVDSRPLLPTLVVAMAGRFESGYIRVCIYLLRWRRRGVR